MAEQPLTPGPEGSTRGHPLAVWRWALHWQILLGLVIGAGLGLASGHWAIATALAAAPVDGAAPAVQRAVRLLTARWDYATYKLLGDLFLNGLKLVVVPLVLSSLVTAVAGLGRQQGFARMGLKTLAYYMVTSLIAILTGLVLVDLIRPGVSGDGQPILTTQTSTQFTSETAELKAKTEGRGSGDFLNVIRQLVPPNLVQAAADNQLLGLIVVALLVGYFTARLPDPRRQTLLDFWQGTYDVTMAITHLVLRFAPIGVAALLAGTLSENYARLALDERLDDLVQVIVTFFFTVLSALGLHFAVTLALIVWVVARVNPLRHYRAMAPALMTAFSTASSNATLPVNLECCERRAGVSNRVSSFVLPLGATVNMDGTALYECVAAMFVAQLYGIELSFAQQFFVVMTALLTSVGVAGVPAASLVAIVIILQGVGVPIEGLAVVLVVDRLLDMCRTAVNVFSDSCGAVVIARSEGETPLQTAKEQAA